MTANSIYMRAWQKAHPQAELAKQRKWKVANAERYRARYNAYHRANRDREREYLRARRRADPAYFAALKHRRRAKLTGNGGSHTAQEWREKLELFANLCAYCGESRPLSIDHKIPISRGGMDNISNIVPACMPCNRRKGTMTDREYLGLAA